MANFVDVMCKNSLTGEVSEFGKIYEESTRAKLTKALDEGAGIKADGIYVFKFDELVFSAVSQTKYLDSDGKMRSIKYSSSEIREYCEDLFKFLRSQTRDFIDYTHDIQYLIGALNAASVVKESNKNDMDYLRGRINRINLLSILISAKSTFFRFLTEDLDNTDRDDVSVTGKTFKICQGIPFLAESYRKSVKKNFNSNSRSSVKMVDIFEFIPYTIVENAIKYGPKDLDIDFDISEDRSDIRVAISSVGPKLQDIELTKIFERGYRGEIVRREGFPGHGLGLFQANKASKILFNGYIFASQSKNTFIINGIPYADTIFTIVLPKK